MSVTEAVCAIQACLAMQCFLLLLTSCVTCHRRQGHYCQQFLLRYRNQPPADQEARWLLVWPLSGAYGSKCERSVTGALSMPQSPTVIVVLGSCLAAHAQRQHNRRRSSFNKVLWRMA
jgi:hypothetical protein